MAATVNEHDAKTHFSALLERVEAGEEVVIARAGKPLAKLVPLRGADAARQPGGWLGRLWIAPDFDTPLPEDLLDAFEAVIWAGQPRKGRSLVGSTPGAARYGLAD
jgi:prevent-host-death family protein